MSKVIDILFKDYHHDYYSDQRNRIDDDVCVLFYRYIENDDEKNKAKNNSQIHTKQVTRDHHHPSVRFFF